MILLTDILVIALSTVSAIFLTRSDLLAARGLFRSAVRRLHVSTGCLVLAVVVAVLQCGLGR